MKVDHKVAKRLIEYTASAINTKGGVYPRVIASEDDNKEGGIEKAIKDWYIFLDYYRENDVLKHQGMHRLESLHFFSGLDKMYKDESLDTYTKNYIAMMMRRNIPNGEALDTVWGTKWNCEHAIQYYFNNPNCFIMEGTNDKETNILKNGFTSKTWKINDDIIQDSPFFIEDAGLINVKGIRLFTNMELKTYNTIQVQNKGSDLYSMHFFMKCIDSKASLNESICITFEHKTLGTVFQKIYNNLSTYEWENKQEYIKLPSGEYNISMKGLKSCDVDFFCLFPVVPYPSVSLIIGHGGIKGGKAMFFAPGKADKIKVVKDGVEETIFTNDIKEGTHDKYKFWFPFGDDTTAVAKEGRKKFNIDFEDPKWGYWTEDGNFISLAYLTKLLDVLLPVGVRVFDIALTKKI